MAANKIVHEPGKYFDCTSMHGKWCTITMVGQDVGYARVGIISSGRDYILFQFRDKTGLVAKAYVKHIVEVKMNERKLKKLKEPETYLNCIDYKIDLNWIDVNNHMNNIYYLELADMILPEEVRKSNNCSNFEIMYKKEIKYGDIIKCYYAELENTSYVVTLKNAETGEICAIIKLYLEKNNKKT